MPTLKLPLRVRAAAELELRRRRKDREETAPPLWTPYPNSPQERAVASDADITGYGGQAGGGKTDWLIGLSLTRHRKSIIFRREYPQLKDVIERSLELVGGRGRYNKNEKLWRIDDGRTIELGAVQYEDDKNGYKGRAHDLKAFDELTEFTESQFRFLIAWNRTTHPNQRCRVIATFNPPTNADGMWVTRYFAPWVDRSHPNPARPGELRWFARVDGEEVERPDGEPFEHTKTDGRTETIRPLSRTFFPAQLKDNPILAATGYGDRLADLPEPLRSQLASGDFTAGIEDDAYQIIPTGWVLAAMSRWRAIGGAKYHPNTSPHVIGHDVAHGGSDWTVNAPRHGDWYAPLDKHKGKDTPDGLSAAKTVMRFVSGVAVVHVDAASWGASSYERLRDPEPQGLGLGNKAVPIDFGGSSEYRDKSGLFKMFNTRAEMYWRMRDALDPENGATLMLPDDPELLADLTAPRFEVRPGVYKVEDKADIKKRIGRSPDAGDAVVMALLPTPTRTKADKSIRWGAATRPGYRG